MNEKRFLFSKKTSGILGMTGAEVITDTDTGVQYLFVYKGYAGGLTLLVDKDGKPLINR